MKQDHPESPSAWDRYRRCPREYAFWLAERGARPPAPAPPLPRLAADDEWIEGPGVRRLPFAGTRARLRHAGVVQGRDGLRIYLPAPRRQSPFRRRAAQALALRLAPSAEVRWLTVEGTRRADPIDPNEVEAEVASLRARRDAEDAWRPRIGPYCEACAYRDRCPAFVVSPPDDPIARLAAANADEAVVAELGYAAAAEWGLAWTSRPSEAAGAAVPVGPGARWGYLVGPVEPAKRDAARRLAAALSLALERAEFRSRADRDALTGLATRRAFDEAFSEAFAPGLYLLLLDVDRFKSVNDRFGHAVGDAALAHVGEILLARAADCGLFAFRYGGEEMGLLGRPPAERGAALAEGVRAAVEASPLALEGGPLPLTVSVAFGFSRPEETPEAFFRRVDAALYRAKEKGRNRVERA